MRPLHWIGLSQLVLILCVPFPPLVILMLPCWVVMLRQSQALGPVDARFDYASKFALAGVATFVVAFILGMAQVRNLTVSSLVSLMILTATSGFIFCTATAVFACADKAGDTRTAKACNIVRWTVLSMTVVTMLTIVTVLIQMAAGGTSWGSAETTLLQISSLGVLGATVLFIYVTIRAANEPYTEIPGGTRHGP